MSVVNASGDEKGAGAARRPTAADHTAAEHQPAWFGIATERAESQGDWFVGIVFNRPLDQIFTYRAPRHLSRIIQPGQRVRVPLGRGDRPAIGYCVTVDSRPPSDLDPARIKDVVEVLDPLPLIDKRMLDLTRWIADYYACAWGRRSMRPCRPGSRSTPGRGSARF